MGGLQACIRLYSKVSMPIGSLINFPAGADVTHSRGFDSAEPSVAAVVGSLNRYATRYSCRIKIQGHRQEMIQVTDSSYCTSKKIFHLRSHAQENSCYAF